jgi:hypothetical protein
MSEIELQPVCGATSPPHLYQRFGLKKEAVLFWLEESESATTTAGLKSRKAVFLQWFQMSRLIGRYARLS